MTADEIRELRRKYGDMVESSAIRKEDVSHINLAVQGAMFHMLNEIAAQLAELNDTLAHKLPFTKTPFTSPKPDRHYPHR